MPYRNSLQRINTQPLGYNPIVFTPTVFTPQNPDMNILNKSLDKIEQRQLATRQQQISIAKILGDLELNPAEDAWKTDYVNNINNQIQSAIRIGDYSTAMNVAMSLGAQTYNDPALRGRIRAQQEYKKFTEGILNRKDLTEDDKSWALANNPYTYEDKYNHRGEVIGGSEWKPTIRPVGEIDYNDLLAKAKQLVFQESGGSTQVVFYDNNDKETTNPMLAKGVKYYKNGTWQGIDKKKLKDLVEAAIDNTPGARARIEQDWKVANWKYNQLSEEEQENNKPAELFAENGRKYSKQEWYDNKFDRPLTSMSGMNYTNNIKYEESYFKTKEQQNLLDSYGGANMPNHNILTSLGVPILFETNDVVNLAFGEIDDSVNSLEKIVKSSIKNTEAWTSAKNRGDYDTLAKYATMYANNLTDENEKQTVFDKIRHLQDNASLINSVKKKGGDFEAIAFNGAFSTGGELPANNIYTKRFMDAYNKIGGKNATKLQYSFETTKDATDFVQTLGLDGKDYSIITTADGFPALVIDKSNKANYKALIYYNDLGYNGDLAILESIGKRGWRGLFNPTRLGIIGLDDNDRPTSKVSSEPTGYIDSADEYGVSSGWTDIRNSSNYNLSLKNIVDAAKNKSEKIVGDMASNKVEVTSKTFRPLRVENAEIMYAGEPSKINAEKQLAYEEIVSDISRMHGSNYEIMMFNPEVNSMTSVGIADRTKALNDAIVYLNNHKDNYENIISQGVFDGKAAYVIKLTNAYNKAKNEYVDGDINENVLYIFNPDDKELTDFQNRTDIVAGTIYDRLSRVNGATHHTFDNNEIKFVNSNPYLNGKETTRDKVLSVMDMDQAYKQLKTQLLSNVTVVGNEYKFTNGYAETLTRAIQNYYGYPVGSPANTAQAQDWVKQMLNELK